MAELVVRMEGDLRGPDLKYNYEFRSSADDGVGECFVEASPDQVRQLRDRLDGIVKEAVSPTPTGTDVAAELAQLGGRLYEALFRSSDGSMPELVKQLRQVKGPLLLRTNESEIPWELLHDGDDFLALGHEIGRRPSAAKGAVPARGIGPIKRALIIGDPTGDLPEARKEAERVHSWLTGHHVDCTLRVNDSATLLDVTKDMETGGYDLVHYCGHVAAPVGKPEYTGLLLHDRDLLDRRTLPSSLAKVGSPPIVFINGCGSADVLANLCKPFMEKGARIVVGTRHLVREEPSRAFAERFYGEVVAGATAGGAFRAARQSLCDAGEVEWATFILYGDPATRVTLGEQQKATSVEPPLEDDKHQDDDDDDDGYPMDDEARAVVDRMLGNAGPQGYATSLDLLMALLPTDVMRARITDAVGARRLAFATEVLHTLRDSVLTGTADASRPVELTDTVNTVLLRADRAAQAAGREAITVGDLVDEFVAVGGSSSHQVLGLLGIRLKDLARTSPHPTASAQTTTARLTPDAADGPPSELFDDAGDLRTDLLDPDVARAVRTAALIASLSGTPITTALLLCGFAVAGGDALQRALERQGDLGATAIESLTPKRRTRRNRFSHGTREALLRALADQQHLGEATLLRHLLADENSSAHEILTRLSIDIDILVQDL